MALSQRVKKSNAGPLSFWAGGLRSSLNAKLTLAFLAIGIVPLVALGFYAVGKANDELASRAGSDLQKAATEVGELVDRNLFERYGDVQAFAANPKALGSAQDQTDIINFMMMTYGIYDLMMIVDLDGTVQAANSVDGFGDAIDNSRFKNLDVSGEEWFRVIRNGETPEGGTYYSDVGLQPFLDLAYEPGRLGLPYSAPIYDNNGDLAAVWFNIASFDRVVIDIAGSVEKELVESGIGTARIEVVRQDGRLVHSPDNALSFAETVSYDGNSAASAALQPGDSGFVTEQDLSGTERLYGYANADGALGFEGYNWGILASQDPADTLTASGLRNAVIIFTIVAAMIIAAVGAYLARGVSKPAKLVAISARRVAAGELSVEDINLNRTDVLGELADSFDAMTDTLGIVGSKAALVAEGNLTSDKLDEPIPGELGQAFDAMTNSLRSVVDRLKSSSDQLAAASNGLAGVSASMSESAETTSTRADQASSAGDEVKTSVATVSSAIDEMNSTIREIASSAAEASGMASNAVETARASSDTIAKLGQSSEEIGNVVKVINSIAEQTNLLALNATIEAARAGEAGKGFAVVANEVKELATQTSKATEEIGVRIQAIQEATTNAVEANQTIGEGIEQISDVSASIAAAVEEQSVTADQIGISVEEAASGTEHIAKSISDVAQAATNTRDSTDLTTTSAAEMSSMASELHDLVSHYH